MLAITLTSKVKNRKLLMREHFEKLLLIVSCILYNTYVFFLQVLSLQNAIKDGIIVRAHMTCIMAKNV